MALPITSPTRPVLITGGGGQLASALASELSSGAVALARNQLDITSRAAIEQAVDRIRPSAIVNCAAFTQVDAAEQNEQAANRINADGVKNLAEVCRDRDVLLLHISTDYVFGGDAQRATPYREDDPPSPVNAYGRSKLAGEQAATTATRHFIVRTCGLYGPSAHGRNFVETILRLARGGKTLSVVDDQRCTPSSAADVAKAISLLLTSDAYGTYHIANAGATTWHHFAAEILRQAKIDAPLKRITSAEYGGTPRPTYSVLNSAKYLALSGTPLRSWREALADYLRERA